MAKKLPKRKRVTVLGKRWTLRFVNLRKNDGDIDPPSVVGKQIRIDPSLDDRLLMEIILHELHHGADWRADEDYVARLAADQSTILWDLGYRRNG